MKFTSSIIFAFLALSCNAQYREIRHSKITPTNTVVIAIPDWAKSPEPPASGDWQFVTNAYEYALDAYDRSEQALDNADAERTRAIAAEHDIAVSATNYTDFATNELVIALTTYDEDRQIEVNHARFANWAGDAYAAESASHADGSTYAANLGENGSANRTSTAIFAQLDAATETNAAQSAAIAGIPAAMTNIAEAVAAASTNEIVMGLENATIRPLYALEAGTASEANDAGFAFNLKDTYSESSRSSDQIFAQLDAATSSTNDFIRRSGGVASDLTVGTHNSQFQTGFGSLEFGTNNTASGDFSIAGGQNNIAKGTRSISLGLNTYASNNTTFVWSGHGNRYGSHGTSTFNVNPLYGIYGFWIGDETLYDVINRLVDETNTTTVAYYDDDSELIEERTIEPLGLAKSSDVEKARREASASFRLFQGSNLVVTITNYNSQVNPPEMSYKQLNESNEYTTVWTETNGLHRTLVKAKAYTDERVSEQTNNFAPKAWSRVTSGMGVEAPSNTTWISTETTVLAGGYEPAKYITTGGEIWVITSKGMLYDFSPNSSNTAYLNIAAADGTPMFRIEKTDSYLLGVDCDSVVVENGNTLVCGIHLIANDHPFARVKQGLRDATWEKEEDSIPASLATVTWTQDGDWWYCSMQNNTGGSTIFAYFEYLQEGGTKIVNEAAMDLSGGIVVNGVHYSGIGTTTVNGKTVLTLEN